LEKGKYTKTPVQTQFGWHVILSEDSRAQTPPSLDSVKEQLKPFLQRKKIQALLETLRKQAKVEILVPLVEEKPKTEAPADAAPAAEAQAAPAQEAEPADATQAPEVVPEQPATVDKAATEAANKPAESAKPASAEPKK